ATVSCHCVHTPVWRNPPDPRAGGPVPGDIVQGTIGSEGEAARVANQGLRSERTLRVGAVEGIHRTGEDVADAVRRDSPDHTVLDFTEVDASVGADRESSWRPHDQRGGDDSVRERGGGGPRILSGSCMPVDDEAVEVVDALEPAIAS